MSTVSVWGIDHGEEIAKADRFRDRKTAGFLAGYGGALAGAQVGGRIAARSAGTSYRELNQGYRANAETTARFAQRGVPLKRALPIAIRGNLALKGSKQAAVGGALGALGGGGAGYGALRASRKRPVSKAWNKDNSAGFGAGIGVAGLGAAGYAGRRQIGAAGRMTARGFRGARAGGAGIVRSTGMGTRAGGRGVARMARMARLR